jgi:hypothetical protein
MSTTNAELASLAARYGAKDAVRVAAGIALAVQRYGEDPLAMLESLRRWQPSLFYGTKK